MPSRTCRHHLLSLALLFVLATLSLRCGSPRRAPEGMEFPRSASPGVSWAERILPDRSTEESALVLDRLAGRFRIVGIRGVLEEETGTALILEGEDGSRVLLHLVHAPDDTLAVDTGELVRVRLARMPTIEGERNVCLVESPTDGLRFFSVRRPPDMAPLPEEGQLPREMQLEATYDRSYLEVFRDESNCTIERPHVTVRFPGDPEAGTMHPGQRRVLSAPDGRTSYLIHVVDATRGTQTHCPRTPADLLHYQILRVPR